VRIWLLGGFSVSVGSRILRQGDWRSKKAATLFKLLALAPGHRMHREQAIDLLWPGLGKQAASNNLRQVLYGARRVLDPGSDSPGRYLSLRDEQLILCPAEQLWVDVDAFEEATTAARRSRDPATYRAAIELYAGELLPEDRYEEWAEGRRAELRQLYLSLLIELAGLYEGRGEYAPAVEALGKATAVEPTLEEAHVSLMRLHALSGKPERALAQYERLRDSLHRSIGTRPAETTRRLRSEIAAGRLLPTSPTAPAPEEPSHGIKHNLPAPRTSFVGREREMVEVKRMLSMTRLLTLTGAGGTGKTRLALEVARDLVSFYPDGVWFVELAPLSEGELVTQEVANALGVQERPGEPLVGTLKENLAGKELLLVIDNCEHVVDEVARLADTLLASCPRLKVLATSREFLDISGEVSWIVPPLSLPEPADGRSGRQSTLGSLISYEAVRLFVDRARLRLLDFKLTQENAGAVARVCHKLEGIPLAIELATARMGALAVEQVAQRLDDSLDVLKGRTRSAAPRQQTLRATLDWSHDLLSEDERTFFRRLSIFAGGWTLEAAEEVCTGVSIEEDVFDPLGELVDKSLVVAEAAASNAMRYRMLEPIRQYAYEKLEESGEDDKVRSRHVSFFLTLAEEAEPKLAGPMQGVWLEQLEREHDNIREALSWVLERKQAERGLRFCGALWRFWYNRGYWSEGAGWLTQALAAGERAAALTRVKALEGMGWLVQGQGDFEQARVAYKEMLEMSRKLEHKGNVATALNSLATLAMREGNNEQATALLDENLSVLRELEEKGHSDATLKRFHVLSLQGNLALLQNEYMQAVTLWEEALTLARQAGDANRVAQTLTNLGYAAVLQGNYRRAVMLCEEALTVAHEQGIDGAAFGTEALVNLGLAALNQGENERATETFREALVVSKRAEERPTIINTLEGMAGLAVALGQNIRAAHLWGAAEIAREDKGIFLYPAERALHEPYLTSARSRLGEAAWDEALAEGRSMSLEEAAEYALSELSESLTLEVEEEPSAQKPSATLTPREKEIAALVAQELTNRQIATNLTLSEHTVATHVRNVLKKLDLHSRTQIAGWITECQPLPQSRRRLS
jgi:predicted ATPase/DNA-binding SARP family transcriptional activator/DNA-binding CsgD family transcriptional regulator